MPRKSRIDAPGTLHHIICRGIERGLVFQDDSDRNNFLGRLGGIIEQTDTRCFAWALIQNHFHLLLKTGRVPIATVMRRLLTGYAVSHNRRHRRHGHLFQNRYKSILCQEDVYFKELVRYIHLNPLRARLVGSIEELDRYAYSGHSAIMGRRKKSWQDIDGVIGLFAETTPVGRRRYRMYLKKGVELGKREDLTGGGLLRSCGGWSVVKALRKAKVFHKSDERILGDSDFVDKVLGEAEEQLERKYAFHVHGVNLNKVRKVVAELMGIEPEIVIAQGKERTRVQAKSLLCYWAVRELGITMTKLSKELNMSLSTVSLAVQRGEQVALTNGYQLSIILNMEI